MDLPNHHQSSLLIRRRQLDIQGWFIPKEKSILIQPIFLGLGQLHIKVENHASQYNAHLNIGQTERRHPLARYIRFNNQLETYFRPMQFLGPKLKGCIACLLSFL